MGNRLHVASTYNVKWNNEGHFDWKSCEFHEFLSALDIEPTGSDRTCDPCPWDFEISKEEWESGIGKLKAFNTLPVQQQAHITVALTQLETTIPDMISIMESYMKNSDPAWEYLEFAFF
ncbi:MAG: hypothetical protein LIP03_14705 [Bacteroidales bacterium]|nr:hypothetical protein [Bacteroidales bacterium]